MSIVCRIQKKEKKEGKIEKGKMKKIDKVVILVTVSTLKEAKKITSELLNQQVAACVNILPRVDSFFWWQGTIDSAKELLLIIKTDSLLVNEVVESVKKLHSYDVPEIIALPIIKGSRDYLEWIDGVIKKDKNRRGVGKLKEGKI